MNVVNGTPSHPLLAAPLHRHAESCAGKRRYADKLGAQQSAKSLKRRHRERFDVYLCTACNCYHLATRLKWTE